jgi:hypothetical protein
MQVHIAAIPAMTFEYFMLHKHEPGPSVKRIGNQVKI